MLLFESLAVDRWGCPLMTIRTMDEKTYGDLKPGDLAWITGALLKVKTCWPPSRGHIRYFDAEVIRAGGGYDEGQYAVFTGLVYGHVLCEILPATPDKDGAK